MGLPSEENWHNSGTVLGHLEENWHGEIKMGARRIAPATIVVRQSIVGRAEIGGRDQNRRVTRVTPFWVIHTFDLKAGSTA